MTQLSAQRKSVPVSLRSFHSAVTVDAEVAEVAAAVVLVVVVVVVVVVGVVVVLVVLVVVVVSVVVVESDVESPVSEVEGSMVEESPVVDDSPVVEESPVVEDSTVVEEPAVVPEGVVLLAVVVLVDGASIKLIVASESSSILPFIGRTSVARLMDAEVLPAGALMETTPPFVQVAVEPVQRSIPKLLNDGGNETTSPAPGSTPDFQLAGFILDL
jgi:hypothetical protein